jgi:hypothetical protein
MRGDIRTFVQNAQTQTLTGTARQGYLLSHKKAIIARSWLENEDPE